jgi:S-adenosylmethionine synthetase
MLCDQASGAMLEARFTVDLRKVICEMGTKDNMVMVAGEIT